MEALIQIFSRDIGKLKLEIESFNDQNNLWIVDGDISNSAGNLCLHLIGNLNHYIGGVIGKSGYVREREAEFNSKNVAAEKLFNMIQDTGDVVSTALKNFDKSKLSSFYPIQVFGKDMTYEFFLIHLTTHLSYHLGQINYLRRLLDSK